MTTEPFGNGPYDSRAEEAIDWYQHYMSIQVEALGMEYAMKATNEDSEPTVPMEEAVKARREEMTEAWMGGPKDE